MNQSARNLVTFRVGSQWYGIDVENIIEISHLVMFNDVPTASRDVVGLMTLRNIVMPVVDLRLRFGLTEPEFRLDTPIIAIKTEGQSMGLIVDDIDNVEQIHPEDISAQLGDAFPFVYGTAQLHNKLLMLVDLNSLTNKSTA